MNVCIETIFSSKVKAQTLLVMHFFFFFFSISTYKIMEKEDSALLCVTLVLMEENT